MVCTGLFVIGTSCRAAPVWSVVTNQKKIAFTFDDGPKPEYSIPLLATLDSLRVRATFFVVGKEAAANIDLIKEMHDRGHEVANHTYTHTRLPNVSVDQIRAEISSTNQVIGRFIDGNARRLFRPPGGQFNTKVIQAAESLGMTVVLWDVNAGDYVVESDRLGVKDENRRANGAPFAKGVTQQILANVKPGSIILMHNGGAIIDVLPQLVTQLRAKGYDMVTVSDLIRSSNAVHTGAGKTEYVPD